MIIKLSKGLECLIDDADFPIVSGYRWYASRNKKSPHLVYAFSIAELPNGKATTIYMHRLITGAPKGKVVDHINHNTLDNRRANLRVVTHVENMQNGAYALATHCPKGHPYDEENTYRDGKSRRCRQCARERDRRVRESETEAQAARRREQQKRYYEENYEACRSRQNEYAAANREKKRVYDQANRPISRAQRRDRMRAMTPEQKAAHLERKRASYWRHRDAILARRRAASD